MSSERRLVAALDSFVRHRRAGARTKRHVVPLVEFAAAELRSRGVRTGAIRFEVQVGRFYQRQVDLIVEENDRITLTLVVITQSGSVRKNLNNRRRDIVGDALNLRAANPESQIGFIYLLRADEEALKKGTSGTSPVEELAEFLAGLQTSDTPLGRPLLDAAALLAADCDTDGKIRIETMPERVNVLSGFFDQLARPIT